MGISIGRSRWWTALIGASGLLVLLAIVKVAVHLLTATGYGYFIDELYYLAMQRHLDFGYVDVPPAVPALMAVSNAIFGTSLFALHIFPAVAGALMLVVVGLTARELGGGRFAQVLAGLVVLVAPSWLVLDSWFAYDAFDQLVTAVLFWAWIRLLKEPSPRRWLIVGVVLGVGLLTKMSIMFTWPALGVALLLSPQRAALRTRWPWMAAGVALLVASPFIAWQALHGWPIVTYWTNYAAYRPHSDLGFFLAETLLGANPVALPLICLGFAFFLVDPAGRRYVSVDLVFLLLAVLFAAVLRAEARLLVSAFLPLIAGGAVMAEQLLSAGTWRPRLRPAYAGLLAVSGLMLAPFALPMGAPPSADDWAASPPQAISLRLGWPEMVAQVADVYGQLPAEDRAGAVIYAGNYGEAAAIDFFGPQYGLPKVISNHNAFQTWGVGAKSPTVVLAVGTRFSAGAEAYGGVNLWELFRFVSYGGRVAGSPGSPAWEQFVPIYICRQPLVDLRDAWTELASYR